jgi:flagellar motor switch protein FliN/FliY
MPRQSQHVGTSETQALMRPSRPRPSQAPSPHSAGAHGTADSQQLLQHDEMEALLKGCAPPSRAVNAWAPLGFKELAGVSPAAPRAAVDPLVDAELEVCIELGRAQMDLADALKLRSGCVVPLEALAHEPVDVFIDGRLVARGELLLLNENYCVRVSELPPSSTARAVCVGKE